MAFAIPAVQRRASAAPKSGGQIAEAICVTLFGVRCMRIVGRSRYAAEFHDPIAAPIWKLTARTRPGAPVSGLEIHHEAQGSISLR
ncbi:MAG: hypothetical protein JJU26_13315, partial [Oceanicaulis sp.]|nr:hypothetical protein [Oceanicaulis sp.]